MKYSTLLMCLIVIMMLVCCGDYNPSNQSSIRYVGADVYNFGKHVGKTVLSIKYVEDAKTVSGCDDLVIYFTDGTRARVHIYKYIPKISE